MDFEKLATEFADGLSAEPIPEPPAEKVERAGTILARNGWNPNVAGEADFTAASSAWANGSKQLSQFINSENPPRTEGGAA